MDEALNRIKVFEELLTCVDSVSLTQYSPTFEILSSTSDCADVMSLFLRTGYPEEALTESVEEINGVQELKAKRAPSVYHNSLGMVWISDLLMRGDEIERILMLGPVFLDDFSVYYIEQELNSHNLSVALKSTFMTYIRNMHIVSLNRLYEYGIMLHYCVSGEKLAVSDFTFPLIERRKEQEHLLRRHHGTHAAEQEILKIVENGNLEYKEIYDRYTPMGDMLHIGSSEYLRQQKNTVIMFITLCSRAAIRGGLVAETAYSLCDEYIRKAEECADLSALTMLNREMFRDFVLRVHRSRAAESRVSPQIRKICDYIRLHPEEKNDIHSLAQMAGYTDYYFSTKFRQETGESLRDYTMRCRIDKAKLLLEDTTVPVSDIAAQVGFGTPSYFGEVFRKFTGRTPSEYRSGK